MEIAAHEEKIARLSDLIGRLDPIEDFEIWMWACMSAATNALNAALHHLGVTQPFDYFPHQIPGLYVEPKPIAPWRWKRMFAEPGDVIHIGLPPCRAPVPERILAAAAGLHVIEDLRETHVRGGQPVTRELAAACADAYRGAMAAFQTILAEPGRSPS
ncbi:MAG TPA: hypothetical protein VMB81_11080 [Candidatus Sulfotelmatobacter sp.]|nr:hypothetical protein [Candidatus Sulfotelmatobacter sp.]